MNWGILSTGRIANVFAETLNHVDGACLYAVASRTKEKAVEFAEKYGASQAYDSYEALASDSNVDVVYIATPMQSHYEDVKMCFEHGKNVLCEKCITINAGQLEDLITLARQKNVFFMEAMWMKFHPAFQKAHEWVNQGRIGSLQMVRSELSKLIPYTEGDRLFEKQLGGGALLDLGVYTVTMATSFLGDKPTSIYSCYCPCPGGADFVDSVILTYPGKAASLNMGFGYYTPVSTILVGTEGRIEFGEYFHRTDTVSLYDRQGELLETFQQPHLYNGYEGEIFEVEQCLRNGQKESSVNPLSDTLAALHVLDEIRRQWNFTYDGE